MADFLNPSTVPIQPASRAGEDGPYAETQRQRKKRRPVEQPEPVEEEQNDDEQKHKLDIDA